MQQVPLFPERASTVAGGVDALYAFAVGISVVAAGLVTLAVVLLAIRYRASRPGARVTQVHGSLRLEILWSAIPLAVSMVLFGWGAVLFFDAARVPPTAMTIHVTGKQWMWKHQHPTGQREINDLHVPVGVPIELSMVSEDVIHSWFVPAFRIKQDVLPGRTSRAWFQATRVGTYPLFCAEYCGTKHSLMIGRIHVLEPEAYEDWLAGVVAGETPEQAGERLFGALRCDTCHAPGPNQRGPDLGGRFGSRVLLQDGSTVVFDEDHVRQSILEPNARKAAGYAVEMPTYAGQVDEDAIRSLTAYLKTLEPAEGSR